MNDSLLIAGKFLDEEVLPKELLWIYKYFDTKVQINFVRYFYVFKTTNRFVDHTVFFVTQKWLESLENRLNSLIEIHKKAREDGDIENIALLESGGYKIPKEILYSVNR